MTKEEVKKLVLENKCPECESITQRPCTRDCECGSSIDTEPHKKRILATLNDIQENIDYYLDCVKEEKAKLVSVQKLLKRTI